MLCHKFIRWWHGLWLDMPWWSWGGRLRWGSYNYRSRWNQYWKCEWRNWSTRSRSRYWWTTCSRTWLDVINSRYVLWDLSKSNQLRAILLSWNHGSWFPFSNCRSYFFSISFHFNFLPWNCLIYLGRTDNVFSDCWSNGFKYCTCHSIKSNRLLYKC